MSYIYRNVFLDMRQYSIAGTPQGGPASGVWDGPLWTLAYEFCCYLVIATLSLVGLLRRPGVVLATASAAWLTVIVITLVPSWNADLNLFSNDSAMNLVRFAAAFLVGSCLYLYRDRIPDSGWIALGWASAFSEASGCQPTAMFRILRLPTPTSWSRSSPIRSVARKASSLRPSRISQ